MVGLDRRCESLHLMARTDGRGPGACTAVLLDLPGDVERGPTVPTWGKRGIDFAHLRFDRFPVPAEALVGRGSPCVSPTSSPERTTPTLAGRPTPLALPRTHHGTAHP